MGKKKNNATLGKSIMKDRRHQGGKNQVGSSGDSWRHTSELNDGYEWGRLNLSSITEQSALDEFLTTAQLAGREFTAEKLNIKVIDPTQHTGLPSAEESDAIEKAQELNKDLLTIPRRPKWDTETTPEELDQRERDSFLEWRRQLALLQEKDHLVITPFERNLEFWRQLWRVIERSDIVVQIVDARNPLLFRCVDLEKYVKEVDKVKENMILISKADLLTPTQRKLWADYFSQQGMKVAFWSANAEMERIKNLENEEEENEEEESEEEDHDSDTDQENEEVEVSNPSAVLQDEVINGLVSDTQQLSLPSSSAKDDKVHNDHSGSHGETRTSTSEVDISRNTASSVHSEDRTNVEVNENSNLVDNDPNEDERRDNESSSHRNGNRLDGMNDATLPSGDEMLLNDATLLTGDELISLFYAMHDGKRKVQEGVTTVGLVGYPNVGKSSTINALLQQKKVPVSATPGRTKHFQTLFVEPTMCLCDCPGLTMPSFVSTKAEMVTNGILPIDQIRDFIPPISLICQRIPRQVLETIYGMNIVKPKEGEDPNRCPTAMEFINAYGYMRGYMTHKGLPDGPKSARVVLKDYVKGKLLYCHCPPGIDGKTYVPVQEVIETKPFLRGEDRTYASRPMITAEGTKVKVNPAQKLDDTFFKEQSLHAHTKGVKGVTRQDIAGKPWRKHNNKKRKEKLRRIYKDLDDH